MLDFINRRTSRYESILLKGRRRVKIGINALHLSEQPTGMGVFTREMARSLYALHPDIKLFTPASVEGLPSDVLFRVPQAVRGSTQLKNNVLRAIYLNSMLPLQIMREKADVLYCPILEYPFFSGVPLIVTVHDLHPLLFPDQFGLSAHTLRSR